MSQEKKIAPKPEKPTVQNQVLKTQRQSPYSNQMDYPQNQNKDTRIIAYDSVHGYDNDGKSEKQ